MINARDFIDTCLEYGYTFWTGVPCSYLSPLIGCAMKTPGLQLIMATSEGEAVGIATGAYLAGKKTVVFCQNSGLGDMVSPLTSLNFPYRIPALLIVSRRGGPHDEPQHEHMGSITRRLLDTLGIPSQPFPNRRREIAPVFASIEHLTEATSRPVALVLEKGHLAPLETASVWRRQDCPPESPASAPEGRFRCPPEQWMTRVDAISAVRQSLDGREAVVATTGQIWRELFSMGHQDNHFYVLGSMGCASAIGLGVSLVATGRAVVVLDGDRAALMKMGNMATVGHIGPRNFIHVVLDNEVYETTGGQPTASSKTDFSLLALACGYQRAHRVDVIDLPRIMREAKSMPGPSMLHVKVSPVSDRGMPRLPASPPQIKDRFMQWLARS
jgi:phosphonopyruvate decarboxylase